jgi:hypothetical protein
MSRDLFGIELFGDRREAHNVGKQTVTSFRSPSTASLWLMIFSARDFGV